MKTCTKCHVEKELSEFHRLQRATDGHKAACKKCRNVANTNRYAADPEGARAKAKIWRAAHPGSKRDACRKWREANPESGKRWYAKNSEVVKARTKKWSADNRARKAQSDKRWAAENPERRAYNAQKSHSVERGIEFLFDLDGWIEWWGADFSVRGKGVDDLQMCRFSDIGPYAVGNVYKASASENHDGPRPLPTPSW